MGFKFNPLTSELDLVGKTSTKTENFSYDFVPVSQTVTVPDNQQMIVDPPFEVQGTLELLGRVVVVELG